MKPKEDLPHSLEKKNKRLLSEIQEGCVDFINVNDFVKKLKISQLTGKPLRIKLGLDPTAADIHLGHSLVLNKLKQLQDFGHQVILLIGDFTALIGDPSGRSTARPILNRQEVQQHIKTYYQQIFLILDPERTEIRFNSEWYKNLNAESILKLAAKYTIARITEREDFKRRLSEENPIALHELLYPLLQGYDSVQLNSDLEIGGTDQIFNLLVGRQLQKEYGQEPQCVLTLPLLEGTDRKSKMSKSNGNTIGIAEKPDAMFGKIMRLSDTLMWRYLELLSKKTKAEIEKIKTHHKTGDEIKNLKIELATELVTRFHSATAASEAAENFDTIFRRRSIPKKIQEKVVKEQLPVPHLLREIGLVSSNSEARRSLLQRAVKIDGQVIEDTKKTLTEGTYIIQVGKRRFAKVKIHFKGETNSCS